ncbi:MAG: hypothetical protein K2M91_02460 [Lachnospiraceae bacterium]|nr:hypothetical protein [Lachnospiraceae bacterium]
MNNKDILLLQEAERKRIAEELHDTTVQDMVHLSQQLEFILLYMDKDVTQAKLEAMVARKQMKQIIDEMRDAIYDLRPVIFDDIGWDAAWLHLKDKLSKNNPEINISFDIDRVDTSDGLTAISIYRIVCEGCQNIVKHAKADKIKIIVKNRNDLIEVQICDNGIGMVQDREDTNHHFGLQFMNERVEALSGSMKIISDMSGTIIKIKIPIERKVNYDDTCYDS